MNSTRTHCNRQLSLMRFAVLLLLMVCPAIRAQYAPPDNVYPDAVFDASIRTARICKADWETSYALGHIDDEHPLALSFDDLADAARNFSYTIVHCDADWKPSRLLASEYMDGFPVNQIRHYTFSFNTLIPYVHYRVELPNEDVRLKVSGNYAVVVFEDGDDANPVLCLRFCITEALVAITGEAGSARLTAYQDEWQQTDFAIRTANYPVENAYQDIKVVILKNGQWYTALAGLKPLFVRQGELDYRHEKATLFPAGNEYRPLDIKDTRFSSTGMQTIRFERPTYHFYPQTDHSRDAGMYLYYEDFNGKYAIQAERVDEPATEADYVYVHFSLKAQRPFADGQIYVLGAFCNYACTQNNLMTYNPDKQCYEAAILMKQGYYNYQYVYLPFGKPAIYDTMLEGNFHDTENDYLIFVYHRGRSSRYDRLIGVHAANTLNRR